MGALDVEPRHALALRICFDLINGLFGDRFFVTIGTLDVEPRHALALQMAKKSEQAQRV